MRLVVIRCKANSGSARQLIESAQRLQEAGAFALVLEMAPVEVASFISHHLSIPTIGIGAGSGCDGQILVVDDLLGRYPDLHPRFVRRYLDSNTLIHNAVHQYADDIQAGRFPDDAQEAFAFPTMDRPASMSCWKAWMPVRREYRAWI